MGLFALAGSLGGAAYLGFALWPWPFLAAWAAIWALAFLFDNRRSMTAAISDGRQPDDPRALALLSYATMAAGVVALSVAGESAIFFIAREVGDITKGVGRAGAASLHTTQSNAVFVDSAAPFDPYVYCAGFLLIALGLMLSQAHRDENILLPWRAGLPFNLLRKTGSLSILICLVRGFWIVGPWWILFVPLLVALSVVPLNFLVRAEKRLTAIFLSIGLGLTAVFWAQAGPGL